jgi:hypothetical protein
MPDVNNFIARAKRDGMIVDKINRALHGMHVVDGSRIVMEAEEERLDMTTEIDALKEALRLLGVDPDEVLPAPPAGDREGE